MTCWSESRHYTEYKSTSVCGHLQVSLSACIAIQHQCRICWHIPCRPQKKRKRWAVVRKHSTKKTTAAADRGWFLFQAMIAAASKPHRDSKDKQGGRFGRRPS